MYVQWPLHNSGVTASQIDLISYVAICADVSAQIRWFYSFESLGSNSAIACCINASISA